MRRSKYSGQRVLAKIPDELKAKGWEWMSSQSDAVSRGTTTWYKAVYVRPFERGVDDEHLVTVVHFNGRWWVRVSTNQNHSASWEAARQEAIDLMREADAQRKPKE